MIALRRALPVAAALVTGLLVAGCGTAATPAPAPAPATAPVVPDTAEAGPIELPWPAPSPAEAAALQMGVDGGSQPWLLNPSDVALSYVAATRGWTGVATTTSATDPTAMTVRSTDGEQVTLTLAQPVRTGPTGIWVVTTEQR